MLPRWTSPLRCFQLLQSVFDLTKFRQKDTAILARKPINSFIYNLFPNSILHRKFLFTDGSKNRGRSRCRGCLHQKFPEIFVTCRLSSGRQLHIYTAELRAILLVLKPVYFSKQKIFVNTFGFVCQLVLFACLLVCGCFCCFFRRGWGRKLSTKIDLHLSHTKEIVNLRNH